MNQKFVAFVDVYGNYTGWTTRENYDNHRALFEDDDTRSVIEFEAPRYEPDLWTDNEVDAKFAELTAMAKSVVRKNKSMFRLRKFGKWLLKPLGDIAKAVIAINIAFWIIQFSTIFLRNHVAELERFLQ